MIIYSSIVLADLYEDWSNSPVGPLNNGPFQGLSVLWYAYSTPGASASVLGNGGVLLSIPEYSGEEFSTEIYTPPSGSAYWEGMRPVVITNNTIISFEIYSEIIQKVNHRALITIIPMIQRSSGGVESLEYIIDYYPDPPTIPYNVVLGPGKWVRNLHQDLVNAWAAKGKDFESWKGNGSVYVNRIYIGVGSLNIPTDPEPAATAWCVLKKVSITNGRPVAFFTYSPTNPFIREDITFDASISQDPDGTIVSYEWDFGDGITGSGIQTNHAYSEAGEYTVTLTVTDNEGLHDSVSKIVTITEVLEPPTASFTYSPTNPLKKEGITLDASASYDPDGTIVSYEWDFGDGGIGSGIQVNHAYPDAGEYTVTLTVIDNDGLKNSLSKNIKVNELCIPLQINGPGYKKFDIVFISDYSYNSESDFLNDVWAKINGAYGYVSPIQENTHMFNFYYVNITHIATIDRSGDQFHLPDNFPDLCGFADVVAILYRTPGNQEFGDWANGFGPGPPHPTIFSAEGFDTKSFLHESGHAIFGLLDEYDGTHYWYPFKPYLNPNIWKTENECRQYAIAIGGVGEWDPDKCRKFTDYKGGWWKIDIGNTKDYWGYDKYGNYWDADPDNYFDDIMTWGNKTDGFGVSSRNRIWWYFNSLNSAPKPYGYPKTTKSIILELEIKNSTIREIQSKTIYGEHPNYFDLNGIEFNINFYSNESLLKSYGMNDPRVIIVEYGSNMSPYRENVNFTLVLPYIENLSIVEIVNSTTTLFSFDISEKIEDLCAEKNGICDEDCGSYYDPDCSIFLQAGWNLISIPFNISNKTTAWLCNQINCSAIFTFQNKTWKYYYPTKDTQTTLNIFDEAMGLWVKVNKSLELRLEGSSFESAKINISQGWSLIGYPYLENKNITAIFENNTVYSYDGGWFSYISGRVFNSLQVLKLGFGYWVRVQ